MLSTSTWYNKKSGKVIETVVLAGCDGLSLGEYRSEIDDLIALYGDRAIILTQITEEEEQLIYVSFEREEHPDETADRLNKERSSAERDKAYKVAQYNRLKDELGL